LQAVSATRVQVCGRLAVTWSGERIEERLPARQGRLLFTYLVVHRMRPRSREQLVDDLWPGAAPEVAGATLRPLLSRLRSVLGADAVAGREQPRLVLAPEAFVDLEAAMEAVHRAEGAIAAGDHARAWGPARVALHTADRGFLPGHDAPWAAAVRERLDDVRLRALECVAAVGLGLGGAELASTERAARRLIELAPFRESGHRALMEALAARGNVAEALLAYERLRVRLRDELGAVPAPEVQALHARLLTGS
jgi:DNA-binding SARP family transcriptional activator